MRVYCIEFADPDNGARLYWRSSKREADALLRSLQRQREREADRPEGVRRTYIPMNKKGLLSWLNANFVTNNG